jgi:hypothetical protein
MNQTFILRAIEVQIAALIIPLHTRYVAAAAAAAAGNTHFITGCVAHV